MTEAPLNILSLGAGVQSTTLLILCLDGTLPRIDAAIFADTGAEPAAVYTHLEWCRKLCQAHAVPLYTVAYGDLTADIYEASRRRMNGETKGMAASYQPPFYTRDVGSTARPGLLRRYCTKTYKIDPILKQMTQIRRQWCRARGLSIHHTNMPKVNMLLGISLDEIERMKTSTKKWMTYKHPLAWDLRWTRAHCLAWLEANGYPKPPRSACVYCPYRTNEEWRMLKAGDAEGWQLAVEIDRHIRDRDVPGKQLFLHSTGEPLESVDLSRAEDQGQGLLGFVNECDGMCGM